MAGRIRNRLVKICFRYGPHISLHVCAWILTGITTATQSVPAYRSSYLSLRRNCCSVFTATDSHLRLLNASFRIAAITAILAALAACASPPEQTDTRCPPLQSYSGQSQSAVLSGLRAMVMLESINERDIDILPLNLREPIKALYVAGPEVRLYINHYGALRAACRALMK